LLIALLTVIGMPFGIISLIVLLIVDLTYKRRVPDVTKRPEEFEAWTQSVILSRLSKNPTQSSTQQVKAFVPKTVGQKLAHFQKRESGSAERGGKVTRQSSQQFRVEPRGRWSALKTETNVCLESSLGGRDDSKSNV
jgi:hypothetical protein